MNTQYNPPHLLLSDIGELNAINRATFRDDARAALRADINIIDIDLSQTRMVNSSGLGALIALHKTMCARGGAVRLLGPTPLVYQMLELTRLHRVFDIIRD